MWRIVGSQIRTSTAFPGSLPGDDDSRVCAHQQLWQGTVAKVLPRNGAPLARARQLTVLLTNVLTQPITDCHLQPQPQQQRMVRELFAALSAREETASSLIDAAPWLDVPGARVVYRTYATLHFCMVIDGSESELGILDLIQVMVETLDRHFKSVCELDIIFNWEKVPRGRVQPLVAMCCSRAA